MRPATATPGAAAALLVVLAGCLAPGGVYHGAAGTADPPRDVLGWEDGYWHDEPLDVAAEDGLDDAELGALVARSMARVEYLRRLEFDERVPVEVISRETFRERWGRNRSPAYHAWNDQVWEALFLVPETENASRESRAVYGASVVGFYSPREDAIVLVSDQPGALRVDPDTLIHELVHALQDQRLRLGFGRTTHDGRTAASGLVEGDANYVQHRYRQRCGRAWECLDPPAGGGGGGGTDFNRGLFLTAFHPYSDGPRLVADLRARGGWAAVNAAYEAPPASTEQVVHPGKYPDDEPVAVSIPDRSGARWEPFGPPDRDDPRETAGEAALFATLWANGVVPEGELQSDDPLSPLDYDHPASDGWEGDALLPYRSAGRSDGPADDRFGYVFRTEWESAEDARAFREAYVEVLRANGARERGDGVFRVPEGNPYADAFRVTRSGTTVTVVNAPTVAALDGVHPRRSSTAVALDATRESVVDARHSRRRPSLSSTPLASGGPRRPVGPPWFVDGRPPLLPGFVDISSSISRSVPITFSEPRGNVRP